MTRQIYYSVNGTPDYELHCDACGVRFSCGDDSYYSWPVLCDAAEAEGWRVHPGGVHRCGACAGVASPRRPATV
jgi:hypothetical protein